MKTYKVTVSDDKDKFFVELIDNLGFKFVELSSSEGKPNVKPTKSQVNVPHPYELDEVARKKAAQVREDSLKDVISRIEQLRKDK